MAQYIDKDALVAEIEKRRSKNARNKLNIAAAFEDNYLLSFINTLEVKEWDLNEEIKRFTMSKELYEADSVIKDCKEPASQNDFKPYQKVLTRMEDGESWEADLFGTYKPLCDNPYHCVGGWWPQCIPYEGNEHLLGTHNNCDKYYVTWEE